MARSVTSTDNMRGSVRVAVLIPCLPDFAQIRLDEVPNPIQFRFWEAMISSELDRLEPELTYHFLTLRVNMHRLVAVEAVEEKPVRAGKTFECRHRTGVYNTWPEK